MVKAGGLNPKATANALEYLQLLQNMRGISWALQAAEFRPTKALADSDKASS